MVFLFFVCVFKAGKTDPVLEHSIEQVKMEVWWSSGQVNLASAVLSVIISNQKQF